LSISPHSGLGGDTPRPRKLRPEAIITLTLISVLAYTKMGATTLAIIWCQIMAKVPAPLARAASMKSQPRTWVVMLSATRAIGGVNTRIRISNGILTPPLPPPSAGGHYRPRRPPQHAATACRSGAQHGVARQCAVWTGRSGGEAEVSIFTVRGATSWP
jgi:hypothetical protein